MNFFFSCSFIYELPTPTYSACLPRTHLFLASFKKQYSNADLPKFSIKIVPKPKKKRKQSPKPKKQLTYQTVRRQSYSKTITQNIISKNVQRQDGGSRERHYQFNGYFFVSFVHAMTDLLVTESSFQYFKGIYPWQYFVNKLPAKFSFSFTAASVRKLYQTSRSDI